MAALAAVSLGATVLVAQRALADASDVVVRGEADALVAAVVADLMAEEPGPPTPAALEHELSVHAAKGLRYVAVVERDGMRIAEAGVPQMPGTMLRPGESAVLGRRVRVAGPLPMPRPPREGREGREGREPGFPPPPRMGRPPMPVLVIELEPPVIEKLRAGLTRISAVAAIASAVLIAFAIAWARTANRVAELSRRAEREQRLIALGSMSSVMAHELRNPLASLKGHAQLLVEDLDDEKKRKKAERVVADAERMELLTTSLLDFVRDGPIERVPTLPAELIARSLQDLPAQRVHVSLDEAPSTLSVDLPRLSRALHNLVDNAIQASPDDQHVELSIAGSRSEAVITVRDHGPGLPPGEESKIFEPFMTTRVRGTGLGLPMARRIAEQHGGTLTGESDPSGGAVFRLRFPNEAQKA
jgi:two-component system, NtrC family, sensor histidine kinase HydH